MWEHFPPPTQYKPRCALHTWLPHWHAASFGTVPFLFVQAIVVVQTVRWQYIPVVVVDEHTLEEAPQRHVSVLRAEPLSLPHALIFSHVPSLQASPVVVVQSFAPHLQFPALIAVASVLRQTGVVEQDVLRQ